MSSYPSGLVYYPDERPGITRQRRGRGFSYIAADGTRIDLGPERARLEAMAVPPAYERVWMTPIANGHLLATGFDARDRKQYRYHPDWSAARSETKFAGLAAFGRALPAIRRRVRRDLSAEAGEPDFALAAAVTLIDRLALRVGHEDYAETNGSYGALTLRRRHVRLKDGTIHLAFTAKGGRKVRRRLSDRMLLRVLEKVRDLPGAELLTWCDAEGQLHTLSSESLNQYLASAGAANQEGVRITAKTFRTWAGTLSAFLVAEAGGASIRMMAEAAAERLHNTPAVARSSYIHPDVIGLAGTVPELPPAVKLPLLTAAEARLLGFLEA
jgi:DNA topoisomerase-1